MRYIKYVFVVLVLFFCGCKHKGPEQQTKKAETKNIPVMRFEREMFGVHPDVLEAHLKGIRTQYNCALLNVFPEDPQYMEQIVGMTKDKTMREIYDTIMAEYADLGWLEKELTKGFANWERYDRRLARRKVITFASGLFDYTHRVVADESTILISIDQYVVPKFSHYAYFQLPMYLVHLSDPQYLVADCMASVAEQVVAVPEKENLTLLDFMIAEGKKLYVENLALPRIQDSILLRYSSEQMEWMEDNAKNAWAYIIQHKLLYEDDYNFIHYFIEDAPHTNCFGNESAPRVASYFGLQIVRKYMKGKDISLLDLLNNTNSQSILRLSGYKPERL